MEDFNLDVDDSLMSSTTGSNTTDGYGANGFGASHHNPFSSGFDTQHPFPTYEQLRNAGFSDFIANSITDGGTHTYSQKELYHVLYESEDPVQAYNDMMDIKAQHAIDKTDRLIKDIENSGLLGGVSKEVSGNLDHDSHYNKVSGESHKDLDNELELGSCDCRSECRYHTGKSWKYSDYGYSD